MVPVCPLVHLYSFDVPEAETKSAVGSLVRAIVHR